MDRIYEYVAFKNTEGVTDLVFHTLFEKRRTIAGIFDAPFEELYSYGMHSVLAENIAARRFNKEVVERELYLAERNNVKIITFEDPVYPESLKFIHFPPQYFYVKGNVASLEKDRIAMVGSRKCSKEALAVARQMAGGLAAYGINIVSGFAYGIDIESHIGAAEKGSTTVVLGSGLLNVYPKAHIKYADKIMENGCFVTEFPFSEMPLPTNFPRRNRIISGLSRGVIVVEASEKSGSLITASYALDQGREVFVVPHFPGHKNSAANRLCRQGARVVETYLDILEDFDYDIKSQDRSAQKDISSLLSSLDTDTERLICEELLVENLSLNDLCAKLNAPAADVAAIMTKLELEGLIIKSDGEKYLLRPNGN